MLSRATDSIEDRKKMIEDLSKESDLSEYFDRYFKLKKALSEIAGISG
jgi:hypothetical protein